MKELNSGGNESLNSGELRSVWIRRFDEDTKSKLALASFQIVQIDDYSLETAARRSQNEPKEFTDVVSESFSTFSTALLTSNSARGLHPIRDTEIAFFPDQFVIPNSNLKDYWEQENMVRENDRILRSRLGIKKLKGVIPDALTVAYLEFCYRDITGKDLIPPSYFIRTNSIRDTILPGLYYAVGRHFNGQPLQIFEYPQKRKHPSIFASSLLVPKKHFWQ